MNKVLIIFIGAVFVLLYSCDKETPKPSTNNQSQALCDSIAITYNGHIKAVVDANCNTPYCHGASVGGFTLGTYAQVKAAAEKPNFLGAIKHEDGYEAMPKSAAKLSDDVIQQFECWEKTGFPEQ